VWYNFTAGLKETALDLGTTMNPQRRHLLRSIFVDKRKLIAICLVALIVAGMGCSDDAVTPDVQSGGTTPDQSWLPVTAFGGQIGFIDAVTTDDAKLYLGGTFGAVDGKPFRNCVVWDGNRWQPVGGSVGTAQMGMVHVIVADGSDVFVAGMFDQLSGYILASNIAHWDGTNWNLMGGGTDLAVRTVTRDARGDVYAGGEFTMAGGKSTPHIARWDGTEWHDLAGGLNQHVMVAVEHWGDIYVGGRFTQAGGKDISYLARWDGMEWHSIGDGPDGFITALAFKGNQLYVGGGFTRTKGGKIARGIARWDGTSWHPVGDGFTGPGQAFVRVLYADGDDLYAGGFFKYADGKPADYIARWRGQGWEPLGSGLDYTVKNITRYGEDLYVTGEFEKAGGVSSPYVARWNEPTSDGQ